MAESWELTTTDQRTEDKLITFIIFCEDENDEPYYFRSFEPYGNIKINCIPNQKKAKLNLLNTLSYCKKAGLMDCVDHHYKLKEGITENIWCVYDRDLENADFDLIRDEDELNFTTSIKTATESGVKVAWSNDAFELWILLHFELVPIDYRLHRNYVYDRLTEIFKTSPSVIKQYGELIEQNAFNYKKYLKKRVSFLTHVLPLLKDKVEIAVNNAKILEEKFGNHIPYHNCNPCTMVHHLVNEILQS